LGVPQETDYCKGQPPASQLKKKPPQSHNVTSLSALFKRGVTAVQYSMQSACNPLESVLTCAAKAVLISRCSGTRTACPGKTPVTSFELPTMAAFPALHLKTFAATEHPCRSCSSTRQAFWLQRRVKLQSGLQAGSAMFLGSPQALAAPATASAKTRHLEGRLPVQL
jgi:hypothetical protein